MGQYDKHIRAGVIVLINFLTLILLSISIHSTTTWFTVHSHQDDFHQTFHYYPKVLPPLPLLLLVLFFYSYFTSHFPTFPTFPTFPSFLPHSPFPHLPFPLYFVSPLKDKRELCKTMQDSKEKEIKGIA